MGPVGSSSAGWPSYARGITADNPKQLVCKSIYKTREENGFTIFNIDNKEVLAKVFSCGGHNPKDGENGEIISKDEIYI